VSFAGAFSDSNVNRPVYLRKTQISPPQVFHEPSLLAKPEVAKPTPLRPEGITFLGGLALLAGITLLIAGITFAIPFTGRWDYGPALIGFWIVLAFGYGGFGQFLPTLFAPIDIPLIVILGILYLATGIGFFSGRRWAWTLGMTLALVGAASTTLQTITWTQYWDGFYAVPGLIVAVLVMVYLTRPLARNFFFPVLPNE
jgi:hypothetical protein